MRKRQFAGFDSQMKAVAAFCLVCMPSLTALAQVKAGTFIALRSSNDEIVVAGDSRNIIGGKEFDDSCKVRAFGGELIFAVAGIGGAIHSTVGRSWDSRTIARSLFLRLSREPANDPLAIRLASAWGNKVKEKLKVEAARDKDVVAGKKPGSDLTSGLFVSFYNKAPLIVIGAVTYSIDLRGAVDTRFAIQNIYREPQTVMLGETDVAAELGSHVQQWEQALPFSVDPIATWAIAAVKFGIDHSPLIVSNGRTVRSIGGPVDAARLTPENGIRWIQIKPSCQQD
jgi:hypothetical protein